MKNKDQVQPMPHLELMTSRVRDSIIIYSAYVLYSEHCISCMWLKLFICPVDLASDVGVTLKITFDENGVQFQR